MHVHLVGNGRWGSGCWLHLAWTRKPLAAWMPVSFDDPAWDETYVAHLAKLVAGVVDERGAAARAG